jgi:hypothetical protein
MGGSGKTVVAAAVCREPKVRTFFNCICFYVSSQTSDTFQALRSIYFQLTHKDLDGTANTIALASQRAKEAAIGRNVLLVIDDAWSMETVSPLLVLDDSTASAVLVTTRVRNLVSGAVEVPLKVMQPNDAVSLIREVGHSKRSSSVPPTSEELAAAKACGYLPLVLSIAGGILSDHGGEVDAHFVGLLKEDAGEVLREGEHGDEHVAIEDRIIGLSLSQLMGGSKDKPMVERLFAYFACFAEDVRVPGAVFDMLAPMLAGEGTKRPALKVKSWLGSLVNSTLVLGTYADGVFMHDIVRQYVISRRDPEELKTMHREIVQCSFLTAQFCGSKMLLDLMPAWLEASIRAI